MSKYTFKCIVPGCSHQFLVEASSTEEAVSKTMNAGEAHNFDAHPDMPIISEEKIKYLVTKGIKKVQ